MKENNAQRKTFHGEVIGRYGLENGYVDYWTVAEAVQAELYENIPSDDDGEWKLINGEDTYYCDSDGEFYTFEMSLERIAELKKRIQDARDGEEVEKWEKDIEMLAYGETYGVCEYYRISEEGAKILMNESDEVVYYNEMLDTYLWGICHCGLNWKYVLTGIPV